MRSIGVNIRNSEVYTGDTAINCSVPISSRVGSIVFATHQGLGVLARSFFQHGIINRVLIEKRLDRVNFPEWFQGASYYTEDRIQAFLADLDILLILERLPDWEIAHKAQQLGIRVVLLPMHELTPRPVPVIPDQIIAPSLLELDLYRDHYPVEQLTIPVDVPWRKRTRARSFVHNSGTPWGFFRNGTYELLQALPWIKCDFQLTVRMLTSFDGSNYTNHPRRNDVSRCLQLLASARKDSRVKIETGVTPMENLWSKGDVFIFPEKYNGLSLPLQEAYASGMLVMAANRYPVNSWLPNDPLIPVESEVLANDFQVPVSQALIEPRDIARTVDEWFDSEITEFSYKGRAWACQNQWGKMRQPILKALIGSLASP